MLRHIRFRGQPVLGDSESFFLEPGDEIVRKKFWSGVVVLFTSLSFLFVPALAAEKKAVEGKSFLWRVMSKSATVYILGSVHIAKSDFYPLPDQIEKNFDGSAVLALEADPAKLKDSDLLQMMMLKALYPEGETLKGHLSGETYDLALQEMKQLGLPMEPFERTRPWFLALTVQSLEFRRLGFDPSYGIDVHFAAEAEGKKRIVELESFDYQMSLMNGLSEREQELFLLYTLKGLAELREESDGMIKAWRTGDEKGMEALVTRALNESPELRPVFERLITRRNREMSVKVGRFLSGKATVFVVVGAAHLVGKEGVIQILRNKGYSVEQM
jgi:uncharacterized protein YbaP (TraB family)